jgi:hypothetical protein
MTVLQYRVINAEYYKGMTHAEDEMKKMRSRDVKKADS